MLLCANAGTENARNKIYSNKNQSEIVSDSDNSGNLIKEAVTNESWRSIKY
jgi:hypothetical protein